MGGEQLAEFRAFTLDCLLSLPDRADFRSMALFGHRSRTDECQPSGEAGALSVAERYRTLRASIRASSWSAAVSRILTVSDGASDSI